MYLNPYIDPMGNICNLFQEFRSRIQIFKKTIGGFFFILWDDCGVYGIPLHRHIKIHGELIGHRPHNSSEDATAILNLDEVVD